MQRKTKQRQSRRRQGSISKRRRQTRKIQQPEEMSTSVPASEPIVESHRFISSMSFNGDTLTTTTKKDDEPVIQRKYTLARDIPIGKEMVDMYLDGKIPERLHHHNKSPMFRNVLVSPADLGLLPPDHTAEIQGPARQSQRTRRRRRTALRHHDHRADEHDRRDDENELRLMIDDHDDDRKKQLSRNLFDLP